MNILIIGKEQAVRKNCYIINCGKGDGQRSVVTAERFFFFLFAKVEDKQALHHELMCFAVEEIHRQQNENVNMLFGG